MPNTSPILQSIKEKYPLMINQVERWSQINSWSENMPGLEEILNELKKEFSVLNGEMKILPLPNRKVINAKGHVIALPLGKVLSIKKRPEAPIQLFFGGHMDTVYSPHVHQNIERDHEILKGPGVTDMKGGIVILLHTLQTFEDTSFASKIGWEILINSDEEIGSPGSHTLFEEAAKRNDYGLIFEPAFSDGSFVNQRKGSANFTVVTKGKAAHAGRDFESGQSAIFAIVHFIHKLEDLNHSLPNLTVNVGHIEGGGPINIVPDLAICRINMRASSLEELNQAKEKINSYIADCQTREGISIQLFEDTLRPPKLFDEKTKDFFKLYESCANDLDIPFHLKESGGVCDGNILSNAGLPTIDSMGAVGGKIHTEEEYLILPSLVERCQLALLLLLKLSTNEFKLPKRNKHK